MGAPFSKIINCEYCIDCIDNSKYTNYEDSFDSLDFPLPPKSCMVSKSKFKEMKRRRVSFN